MEYLTKLLGTVAAFGVRAEDAARDVIERTADEFALAVSQTTGISFDMLTSLKHDVILRVARCSVGEPGFCRGRTKHGVPCKKRVFKTGLYCEVHRDQHSTLEAKKQRLKAHVSRPSSRMWNPYGTEKNVMVMPARYKLQVYW